MFLQNCGSNLRQKLGVQLIYGTYVLQNDASDNRKIELFEKREITQNNMALEIITQNKLKNATKGNAHKT